MRQTPSIHDRAVAVLEQRRVRVDGDFYLMESSVPGEYYRVSERACQCPSFKRYGKYCKHTIAARELNDLVHPAPDLSNVKADYDAFFGDL